MAPTACPLFAGLLARSTGRLLKSEACSRGNFLSRALPLTWKRQLSPTATAVHSPDRPWERPVSVNPRRVENAPSSNPGSSYHWTGALRVSRPRRYSDVNDLQSPYALSRNCSTDPPVQPSRQCNSTRILAHAPLNMPSLAPSATAKRSSAPSRLPFSAGQEASSYSSSAFPAFCSRSRVSSASMSLWTPSPTACCSAAFRYPGT